jgi:hypothetical protein
MNYSLLAITTQILGWSIFVLITAQSGCDRHPKNQNDLHIQDYILWPEADSNYFRVYEHYEGEWTARMFLNQRLVKKTPSEIIVTHFWLHGDSTPINRSLEMYGADNHIEYLKQSYFEPNTIGLPVEYEAELLPPTKFKYNDPALEMKVFYDINNDPKATMNFDSKISYKLEQVNDLDSIHPVLVLRSNETVHMKYSDKRENTTNESYSELIYKYKVGLVRIKQSNAEKAIEYNLVSKL